MVSTNIIEFDRNYFYTITLPLLQKGIRVSEYL